ncbi:MAG TPA: TolC family protein [Candidatus Saccharimonadales bacterium]|nr:TolC family protein [Candidatus Saccharimonadales bacterium]
MVSKFPILLRITSPLLRLFDEFNEMEQSPAPMQLTNFAWIALSCVAIASHAQTPAPISTQAPDPNTRVLSLDEALRLSVEHNLDVKIQRLDPEIARYQLQASYGFYDPHLNFVINHEETTQEGKFVGGLQSVPSVQKIDSFGILIASGPKLDEVDPKFIVGNLPTGLKYALDANINHRTGTRGASALDQYDGDVGIILRQPLLRDAWIDAPRAAIAMNKNNLTISEFALELKIMQVILNTQQAYYDLVAATDNVKVRQNALELAGRAVNDARKRVQAGTMLPLTEKSAESASASAKADLLSAQRQRDFRENVLKSMITDDYERWHVLSIAPSEKLLAIPQTYNLQASWVEGLMRRPDFKQIRAEVERQGIQVSLRNNQLFPTLDLTGAAGRTSVDSTFTGSLGDVSSNRNPTWAVGVIVSIPFTFMENRNNYKAARSRMKQMELELQKAHQNVIISIEDAVKAAQSAYEGIMAQREARVFAETALDAALKRFQNDRVTSYEVLQVERDLTAARSLEIQALADYNKALAQLYFNEGTILKRAGLELKTK